ncbi:MAG: hypothetical protein K2G04_11070 [Oscillospiraceae bacterium]|nr:hypothetical protein [Oscillospiraceae bacterium]
MNHAYKLKKEYSESGIPVIIADEELKILWKNNIGGLYPDLGESAKAVFGGGRAVTGLVTSEIGGEVCTFNVIKTEDGESGRFYYIIELIASNGLGGSVPSEAVR